MELIGNVICLSAFIITYLLSNIYLATWVLIGCSLALLVLYKFTIGISNKHYIVTASICALGGLTLWFQNDLFIKIKPTLVFCTLSVTMAISHYGYQKSWSTPLLQPTLPDLPEHLFDLIDKIMILFYAIIGLINLIVAFYCTTHMWMLFKTVGILSINLSFFALMFTYLQYKEKQALKPN